MPISVSGTFSGEGDLQVTNSPKFQWLNKSIYLYSSPKGFSPHGHLVIWADQAVFALWYLEQADPLVLSCCSTQKSMHLLFCALAWTRPGTLPHKPKQTLRMNVIAKTRWKNGENISVFSCDRKTRINFQQGMLFWCDKHHKLMGAKGQRNVFLLSFNHSQLFW